MAHRQPCVLQPWLKADVTPPGMAVSEAGWTSSSPQEPGVPKERQLFGRSAGWRHSDFGFSLQFRLQAQNPAVHSPSRDGAAAARCPVKLLQLGSFRKPCRCSRAGSVVSESEVAGTDGLPKRSWSRRLAPWPLRRAR